MELREDETLDELQLGGLRIIQKRTGFRFGMDAVLLADFARFRPRDHLADFGTGTGILPLLLHGRGKGSRWEAFEIQPEMAEVARRNAALNGLEDRLRVHCLPVERAEEALPPFSLDGIICNPPYGEPGASLRNPAEARSLARHQGEAGLLPWFETAWRLLRGKGRFAMIYPAHQLLTAMDLLRQARLTPKRFRLVYPDENSPAKLALIEAVRDGRPTLIPEPPLIVNRPDGTPTETLRRIYHME